MSYSFVRSLGTGSTGTRNGSNGTTPEISPPATTSKTVERTVKDRVVRQRIYDVIDSEEENIVEEDDDDDDDDFEPSKVPTLCGVVKCKVGRYRYLPYRQCTVR